MSENGHRPLCEALTKAGERCRLPAQEGSRYCYRHRHLETTGAMAVTAEEETASANVAATTAPTEAAVAASAPTPPAEPAAGGWLAALQEGLERLLASAPAEVRDWVKTRISPEWFEPQTWQGLAYVLSLIHI
ncbi:MAG: hypothetical protein N2383_00950, partial [Caldilineales bacterium]|nr:hypothetical protein [Caldilineales bacterium]